MKHLYRDRRFDYRIHYRINTLDSEGVYQPRCNGPYGRLVELRRRKIYINTLIKWRISILYIFRGDNLLLDDHKPDNLA